LAKGKQIKKLARLVLLGNTFVGIKIKIMNTKLNKIYLLFALLIGITNNLNAQLRIDSAISFAGSNCQNKIVVTVSDTFINTINTKKLINYENVGGAKVDSITSMNYIGIVGNRHIFKDTIKQGLGLTDSLVVIDSMGNIAWKINNNIPNLSIASNTTTISCNTSSACITAIGGTPPYFYTIGGSGTINTNGCFSGLLSNAVYTISITDAMGCNVSATIFINGGSFNANVSSGSVFCNTNSYNATANATGGTPPYTFNWSNGNTGTSTTLPLSTSNYVIVSDNAGCIDTAFSNVTNSNLGSGISNGSVFCNTNSYNATASATGGIPPYTYSWSNGNTGISTNLPLSTSNYVIVSDNVGCVDTAFSNGSNFYLSAIPYILDNNSCNSTGNNNSKARINVTNGIAPYAYSWSNGATGATSNTSNIDSSINIPPNGSQVIISDASGCLDTVVINLPNNIFTILSTKDTICEGEEVNIYSTAIAANTSLPFYGTAPIPTSAADGDISSVTIGTLNNLSGCSNTNIGGLAANGLPASIANRYGNYTQLSPIQLMPGTVDTIQVGITGCNSNNYSYGIAVFIDLNRNGTFDLPTERVVGSPGTITSPTWPLTNIQSYNFTIPINAVNGNTLMRVITAENINGSSITPYTSYTWGETEDYIVTLGQSPISWYANNSSLGNLDTLSFTTYSYNQVYGVLNNNNYFFCNDTAMIDIIVKDTISSTISMAVNNASCLLSNDGSISIGVSPAINSLTYTWSPNVSSTSIANNLYPNLYSIFIEDSLGRCSKIEDSVRNNNINCGTISGFIIEDKNNNCLADVNEPGITNKALLYTPSGTLLYTNSNGYFQLDGVPYGTHTLVKQNNLIGYNNNCTSSQTFSTTATSPNYSINFFDTAIQFTDYSLSSFGNCLSWNTGFIPATSKINLHTTNGSFGTSAFIYVKIDSINYFSNSTPAPTNASNDTLYYLISNSNTLNSIDLNYNIPPTVSLGTTFNVKSGIISYIGTDTIGYNNQTINTYTVCNSYDPNDKAVSPAGLGAGGYITKAENQLSYLVNFQNTGNATAVNVIIVDTLDTHLNEASLIVTNASHNYVLEVINGNIIKFKFLNIMLPDSGADYAGSNGFISFRLLLKASNNIGDVINNTAYIYFDNNPPIITNTTINTLYETLVLNGANTIRNTACNTPCGNGSVTIIPQGGIPPLQYTISPNCSTTSINGNVISNLSNGVYTITADDISGVNLSTTILILKPEPIIPNLTVTQAASGVWGTASINPIGGTAPYDILWTPGGQKTNSVNNLQAGTYTANIIDANGCDTSVIFTINIPTDLDNITNDKISIYPNPTNGELHLNYSQEIFTIQVFNTQGVKVYHATTNGETEATLNLKTLSDGTYLIKINNNIYKKINKFNN
jgi:hypothetical protein